MRMGYLFSNTIIFLYNCVIILNATKHDYYNAIIEVITLFYYSGSQNYMYLYIYGVLHNL